MQILIYECPYISVCISALNVHKSLKFPRLIGNRGWGTQRWRQISDQKWKHCLIVHAPWKICNITLFIRLYCITYNRRCMFHGRCTRPSAIVPSPLPLQKSGTCCRRRSRHYRHWRHSSAHWRQKCSADHTATYTTGNSSIDTSVTRDTQRPWSFCKTCVAMKFVDDDDDDDDLIGESPKFL